MAHLRPDLGGSITEAINRIKQQSSTTRELGLRTVGWTCIARRPLRDVELQHALAIELGDTSLDPDGLTSVDLLLRSCAGLVVVEFASRTMRPVNKFVLDALHQASDNLLANANIEIAWTCLTLLHFTAFREYFHSVESFLRDHAFLEYCTTYWAQHIHSANNEELDAAVLKLLEIKSSAQLIFQCRYYSTFGNDDRCPRATRPLELAAFEGLTRALPFLVIPNSTFFYRGTKETSLFLAAAMGRVEAVKILLDNGARVTEHDSVSSPGSSRRHMHTHRHRHGHDGCAETWWYPPWARSCHGGGPLQAAAEIGSVEMVNLLIHHGADPSSSGGIHGSALSAAAFAGFRETIEALLRHSAKVTQETLHSCVYLGHADCLDLLLGFGDTKPANDTAAKSSSIWSSELLTKLLYASALMGHLQCVNVALAAGAKVGVELECLNRTPLQVAASQNHTEIMRTLFSHGADVNNIETGETRLHRAGNALQAASFNGHAEAVGLLASCGGDVNQIVGFYGTALEAASLGGHIEVTKLLLDCGALVNGDSGHFGNPLQAAASRGHSDLVQALLSAGADVNAQGGKYGSALQAAARSGDLETVRLLLENGAKIETSGGVFGSALQAAAGGLPSDILESAVKTKLFTAEPFHYQRVPHKYGEWKRPLQQMQQMAYRSSKTVPRVMSFGKIPQQVEDAIRKPQPQDVSSSPQTQLQQQPPTSGILGPGMAGAASTHFHHLEDYCGDPTIDRFLKAAGYPNGLVPRRSSATIVDEDLSSLNELWWEVNEAYRISPENTGVMKLLLEYGADPDAEGGYFGTALIAACSVDRADAVRWLIEEAGAEINKRVFLSDGKCVNALSVAARKSGMSEITRYLMSRGANLPSGAPLDPADLPFSPSLSVSSGYLSSSELDPAEIEPADVPVSPSLSVSSGYLSSSELNPAEIENVDVSASPPLSLLSGYLSSY